MENKIVKCDKCNEDFSISTEINKRNLGNNIEETYFNCPLCNAFYSVIITNIEIRELIDKQKYLRSKLTNKNPSLKNQEGIELFRKRQMEINKLVEELYVSNKEGANDIKGN